MFSTQNLIKPDDLDSFNEMTQHELYEISEEDDTAGFGTRPCR